MRSKDAQKQLARSSLKYSIVVATDSDIPKKIFVLLFGKIYIGLYSKLSANITWVAVIEYFARKPFF